MHYHTFRLSNKEVRIQFECLESNELTNIIIPFYRKEKDHIPQATLLTEKEFVHDAINLLPHSLYGNLINNVSMKLIDVIQKHIEKHKRLLNHDRETYIGICIIIIESISNHFNDSLSISEKQELFKILSDKTEKFP